MYIGLVIISLKYVVGITKVYTIQGQILSRSGKIFFLRKF